MNKAIDFIKDNILIAAIGLVLIVAMFFAKPIAKMFRPKVKRRRRRKPATSSARRSTSTRTTSAPRSTSSKKGYAGADGRTIPLQYNKDGTVKKAWQVKGTKAARDRMRRLRKNR